MINSANRFLLWSFLFLVYFVHYETTLVSGTLHSWVLFAAILFVLPQIVARCVASDFALPVDYALAFGFALLLVLGFIVNLRLAHAVNLQAYLLSVWTYLFVRHTAPLMSLNGFFRLNAIFLIANSVLMVVQLATGEYFPARYLAAGDPPLLISSGFADGPTKNGMIHASALALTMARVLFMRPPLWSLAPVGLVLGLFTLLLTTSRAGVVGFVAAALLNLVLLFAWRRRLSPRPRIFRGLVMTAMAAVVFVQGGRYVVSEGAQTATRAESSEGQYAAGVVAFKFVPRDGSLGSLVDGSVGERFGIYKTAIMVLGNSPQALALGIGLGAFAQVSHETTTDPNQLATGGSPHNSVLELLIETGVLPFTIFLWLVIHVCRRALSRNRLLAVPFLSAMASTMLFMLFHDVLRGRMFWIPLGIMGAIAYYRGPADETAAPDTASGTAP